MTKLSDTRLLDWAKEECNRAEKFLSKWREEARESYGFVEDPNEQWGDITQDIDKDQVLADMKEEGRPAVAFNRIEPMIEAVCGVEVNNRLMPNFLPFEPDDTAVSDVSNAIGKWAFNRTGAENENSDVFRNTCITGYGWGVHSMSYDEDPMGKFIVSSEDPFDFLYDPKARKANLTDAKWRARFLPYTPAEFIDRFPKKQAHRNVFGLQDPDSFKRGEEKAKLNPQDIYEFPSDEGELPPIADIRVLQFQYWQHEARWRIADPTTGEFGPPLKKDEYDQQVSELRAQDQEVLSTQIKTKVFYQAFFSGEEVLEHEEMEYQGFTMECLTGRRDRNKGYFYGIVRAMKGPQRWQNKFLSTFIYHYMTSIKGGLLVEEDAVSDEEKLKKDLARPGAYATVNNGAVSGQRIKELQPTNMPGQLDYLLQYATNMPQNTSGLTMEFMGTAGRDQAIGLEQERKFASMTILAPLFANFRIYRMRQGTLCISFAQKFIPARALRRAVGQQLAPNVDAFKKADLLRYDVQVDESPISPSLKGAVFGLLMQIFERNPQMGQLLAPDLIEFSPLPASIAAKVKGRMEQAMQPDPNAQQMMQIEQFLKTAQGRKALAEALKAEAEAEKLGMEADSNADIQKMQIDTMMKAADLSIKRDKLASDERIAKMDVEAAKQNQGGANG